MSFSDDHFERRPPEHSFDFETPSGEPPLIDRMLGDLGLVAKGTDVAYNLSSFLHGLQISTEKKDSRISDEQKENLLNTLFAATKNALELFHDQYSINFAATAIEHTKSTILKWSTGFIDNNCESIDADGKAFIRCLRNACHNLSLIEEIQLRAEHRRRKAINSLLEKTDIKPRQIARASRLH